MLNGAYVSRLVPTYAGHLILGSYKDSVAGQSVIEVTDASTFVAGDRVEFLTTNAANGERLWGLTDPAQVATYGGVYDRILDRPTLSGVVNRAPNPYVRDYTGTVDAIGFGQITSNTTSPIVTFSSVVAVQSVSIGDVLVRNSDGVVVGNVLTVDSSTQVTLTANALITDTAFNFRVRKPAPAGSAMSPAGGFSATFLSAQVNSPVPGVTSKAWQIQGGIAPPIVSTPVMPLRGSALSSWTVWCWVVVDAIPATSEIRVSASGAVGDVVFDDTTPSGSVFRVVFSGITAISSRVSVQGLLDGTDYTIGPWGAQPSAWEISDTEAPRACDLWHEATIWLQDQVVPVGYALDIADLEQIDGTQFPYDGIALGGTIRIDDRDLGIVTDQRVVAFTRDYLRPGDVSLTLGRRDKTLAEYLAETSGQSSVSDIALQLSRGLFTVARRAEAQPVAEATSSGVTVVDTAAIFTIGESLRESFTEGQ
jgi:hypothetical protein